MWNFNELIVLSDLHLTAERDTGPFQSDKELAQCLHWILTETQDCVVVLAGDALDFLIVNECPSKRGFDRFSCQTKRIVDHHPEIFDALTKLAHSPRHQLIFMGGESDSEMILPQVQETIERRLGIDTNPAVRWLVQGEALRVRVGQAVVLVEHGNALDPWNRIEHAHLQAVLALASRNLPEPHDYCPPLGIQLVSRIIKDLRRRYRWIDCLKPANELILPLLWPIASEPQQIAILDLFGRYESMKTEASIRRLGNNHDPMTLYQGEKEAERSPLDQVFKKWVDAIYEQRVGSLTSLNGDLIEKARLILKQTALLKVDRPNDTIKCLQPVFNAGTHLIIHGHTHAAKTCVVEGAFYLNTGTWSQILRLPQSDSNKTWQEFFEHLRADSADSFLRPTFAHVHNHNQTSPAGLLLEWRSSGPTTLAAHQLADAHSH